MSHSSRSRFLPFLILMLQRYGFFFINSQELTAEILKDSFFYIGIVCRTARAPSPFVSIRLQKLQRYFYATM
jgi:hypothetical protein